MLVFVIKRSLETRHTHWGGKILLVCDHSVADQSCGLSDSKIPDFETDSCIVCVVQQSYNFENHVVC